MKMIITILVAAVLTFSATCYAEGEKANDFPEQEWEAILDITRTNLEKLSLEELLLLRSVVEEAIAEEVSLNRLNPAEITYGSYITDKGEMGENPAYITSGYIPVSMGEKMSFQFDAAGGWRESIALRWVAAYDENKNIIPTAGAEYVDYYTVPDGVKYIRFCVAIAGYVGSYNYACVPLTFIVPFEAYGIQNTFSEEVKPTVYSKIQNGIMAEIGTDWVADGENHDLCGYSMTYHADIPNGLIHGVEFGKGKGIDYGGYVKVDPTNVSIYFGKDTETSYVYPHGLTFIDYIDIRISVAYDAKVSITVTTNGGSYIKDGLLWSGVQRGAFFAKCTEATHAKFAYSANCWSADNHVYGDSYLSANGDNRWTHYLMQKGATNVLLNAYSGRKSEEAFSIFKDVMQYCDKPDRIIWCLGMNDGDNGAVNENWKMCVEQLMSICKDEGIELILATIPNASNVDNTYKNAYVRESGYRYIDFAAAVGASHDAIWYNNMLSNDGIHPDVQGAVAMYSQAVIDVPELLN